MHESLLYSRIPLNEKAAPGNGEGLAPIIHILSNHVVSA